MNKLTARQLLMINSKLTGKEINVSEKLNKTLEDISKMPYEQNEMFFYKYKDSVEKAAKLGCSVVKIKPFVSKNRQTAVLAMLTLLKLNGVRIERYEKDIPQLVSFLDGDDFTNVCRWILTHKVEEDDFEQTTET